ncbi:MAG: signal transduction histidine kinase [Moritella sp.]|jgi:signal transduction histidine kinase
MVQVRSAKQLTFLYFSIVAFAIITIYATVLDSTLEGIEQLSIQNRLLYQKEAIIAAAQGDIQNNTFKIDEFTTGYLGRDALPESELIDSDFPIDEAVEITQGYTDETEFFVMKFRLPESDVGDIYIVHQDPAFELGEEEILRTQAWPILTSLGLLVISLMVVLRISDRLTAPVSLFAKQIANRSPDDTTKVELPPGLATRELLQLVESYNHNQQQMKELIERERSFNRMASHELRTPLMVMKGATSLLSYSSDEAFIKKQQTRLKNATDEMNDFIEALLSLTKSEKNQALSQRLLSQHEIEGIINTHIALLDDKSVVVNIEMRQTPSVAIPESSFKLLLGNLLKNAFACTDVGSVTVIVESDKIDVKDTGIGLDSKPRGDEGYGLGLLIAKDICRKYSWTLTLARNETGGCTALIRFSSMCNI